MKHPTLLSLLLLACSSLAAQDFNAEFSRLLDAKDTAGQRKVLAEWEKTRPKDAELYTCWLNYSFRKARKEELVLSTEKPAGEALEITDSTHKPAGYLGSNIVFDPVEIGRGLTMIDRGIALYPDRLDMRFGKIYILGAMERWDGFTSNIIAAIQYSAVNGNNWTWTNNEKQPDGKEFFLSSLQDYQVQLYKTEDDKLLANMREIAIAVLKLYPDHVESLSDLAITYMLDKDYDKALEALLKAEKIAPEDCTVLGNIAQAYKRKGEKEKAIKYLGKVAKYGNEEERGAAEGEIRELKE